MLVISNVAVITARGSLRRVFRLEAIILAPSASTIAAVSLSNFLEFVPSTEILTLPALSPIHFDQAAVIFLADDIVAIPAMDRNAAAPRHKSHDIITG
jgi:hypothetical protein